MQAERDRANPHKKTPDGLWIKPRTFLLLSSVSKYLIEKHEHLISIYAMDQSYNP